MTTEAEQEVLLGNELERTLSDRRQLYDQVVKVGKLPDDPKMVDVALRLLDGIDKNALGRLKVQVAKKQADGVADLSSVLTKVLQDTQASRRRRAEEPIPVEARMLQSDDKVDTVPGEMEVGVKSITYGEMESMAGKVAAAREAEAKSRGRRAA